MPDPIPDGWRLQHNLVRRWLAVPPEEAAAVAADMAARGMAWGDYALAALRDFRGAPVESACVPLAAVTTDALQSELERRALPHSSTGTRT